MKLSYFGDQSTTQLHLGDQPQDYEWSLDYKGGVITAKCPGLAGLPSEFQPLTTVSGR